MFSDRKILFGIGIGIVMATLFMFTYKINLSMDDKEIETRARSLGMEYPSEFKVINKKDVQE